MQKQVMQNRIMQTSTYQDMRTTRGQSSPGEPKLLEQVRERMKALQSPNGARRASAGSIATCDTTKSGTATGVDIPLRIGNDDDNEFLTWLAVERSVATSTQNQALRAIPFLFEDSQAEGRIQRDSSRTSVRLASYRSINIKIDRGLTL